MAERQKSTKVDPSILFGTQRSTELPTGPSGLPRQERGAGRGSWNRDSGRRDRNEEDPNAGRSDDNRWRNGPRRYGGERDSDRDTDRPSRQDDERPSGRSDESGDWRGGQRREFGGGFSRDRFGDRSDRFGDRERYSSDRGDRSSGGDRSGDRGDRPSGDRDRYPSRGFDRSDRGDRNSDRGDRNNDRNSDRGDRSSDRGDRNSDRGDRNSADNRGRDNADKPDAEGDKNESDRSSNWRDDRESDRNRGSFSDRPRYGGSRFGGRSYEGRSDDRRFGGRRDEDKDGGRDRRSFGGGFDRSKDDSDERWRKDETRDDQPTRSNIYDTLDKNDKDDEDEEEKFPPIGKSARKKDDKPKDESRTKEDKPKDEPRREKAEPADKVIKKSNPFGDAKPVDRDVLPPVKPGALKKSRDDASKRRAEEQNDSTNDEPEADVEKPSEEKSAPKPKPKPELPTGPKIKVANRKDDWKPDKKAVPNSSDRRIDSTADKAVVAVSQKKPKLQKILEDAPNTDITVEMLEEGLKRLDLQDKSIRNVFTNSLARAVSTPESNLSLNSLVSILQKQRSKDFGDILSDTLVALKEKKGERALRDLTQESKVDVLPLIAAGKAGDELDELLRNKGLIVLKPLPNLKTDIQSALTKKDAKAALQLIKDSVPDDANVSYLAPLVGSTFGSVVFPNKETVDFDSLNGWTSLLIRVVGDDLVAQSQLLSACHGAWNSGVKSKDSIISLWEKMKSLKVTSTEGIMAWKDNTKDKTPGKVPALLALNAWLEALKPKEPDIDPEQEDDVETDSYLVNPNAAFFK